MVDLFMMILRMSAQGAVLVAGILLARLLMKRSAARYRALLWLLLLARLLVPFDLASPVSVFNALPAGTVMETIYAEAAPTPQPTAPLSYRISDEGIMESALYPDKHFPFGPQTLLPVEEAESTFLPVSWESVVAIVWICGAGILLAYMCAVYVAAYLRVRGRLVYPSIAVARGFHKPFIIGIRHPIIALPAHLGEEERRYALAHERAHIRRLDHIWHFVMTLAVCAHWFNPFAWIALRLMSADCEAACDEATIRGMNAAERKAYATALLNVAARASGALPSPFLMFSGGGIKGRIKAVLANRRNTVTSGVAAILLIAVLGACGLTSALPDVLESVTSSAPPSATLSPVSTQAARTPEATAEPVLALNENGSDELFTYDGENQTVPTGLPAWRYRVERSGNPFNLEDIARRLWGGEPYELRRKSEYDPISYREPGGTSHGFEIYVSGTNSDRDPNDSSPYVLVYQQFFDEWPERKEPKETEEEARAIVQELIERMTGDTRYTAMPMDRPGQTISDDEYVFEWAQVLNGLPMNYDAASASFGAYGVSSIRCSTLALEPLADPVPENPLTLEQALYVINYSKSQVIGEQNPILRSLNIDRLSTMRNFYKIVGTELCYTELFSANRDTYAPAWRFYLSYSTGDNPPILSIYVDAATGDMYDEFRSDYWPSPYTARGSTEMGATHFAQMERGWIGYMELFPYTIGKRDGYTYILMPPDYTDAGYGGVAILNTGARIIRRDDATGEEKLLDDRVAYWVPFQSNMDYLRSFIFVAMVDNRIVFRGYEEDWDYKSNGRLVSIALDGTDRQSYEVRSNVMSHLCVDGGRVYYVGGHPRGEGAVYPLNYVTPDLKRDIHVFTSDLIPFAVRDGTVYGMENLSGSTIYRRDGDKWEAHEELPFTITGAQYMIERDAWRMTGGDGQSYEFNP